MKTVYISILVGIFIEANMRKHKKEKVLLKIDLKKKMFFFSQNLSTRGGGVNSALPLERFR